MKTTARLLAVILFAACLLTLNGQAADHTVFMTPEWTFSPDSLEITAGDTVTWVNNDDFIFHNAGSDTGLWNTGFLDYQESATLQFDTPGNYPYHDSLVSTMTGTIVVHAASVVTPALLAEPRLLPNGSFRFTLTGLTAGKSTTIETSTNLLNWLPIFTAVPAGDTVNFTNPPAAGPLFFRCGQTL